MSTSTVVRPPIRIAINVDRNEATIIKDLFGAMSDHTTEVLLKGKNHKMTDALNLTAEIYYDLDHLLDEDNED